MSLTEPTFFHYFSFYKISLIITVIYQSISPKFPKFICYCLNTNQRHSAHNSLFLIKKKQPFFTLIVYSYTKYIFKFYLHVNMKKVNGNTARFALDITVST